MDLEKRARRQSLKVIISEIIMVIAVIVTVVVLAFLVSGYWIGSGFKVERQGMLQIHSMPTGANVEVDGDAPWFQRTNTSKVLSSGEHEIKLTKDGYDSWHKTVNISEGLLYRLQYPRLFLLEREKSVAYDTITASFSTISPDYNSMLLVNNTTTWTLLKLDREEVEAKPIDISSIFSSVSKADGAKEGLFTGEVISANWSSDNEHILFEINGSPKEWVILNVKNPKDSVNITREFAADFDEMRIFDNSANNLFALRGNNLHKIDVASRQISAVIAENIKSYDFYESDLIYFSENKIFLGKLNDEKTEILTEVEDGTKILISKFYDEKYIFMISKNNVKLFKYENFELVFEGEISFVPKNIKIGHGGSFIFMQNKTDVAVLDMEIMDIREWQLDSTAYGWLDSNMLYAISDGKLIVYDFDGLNRRELSNNVSTHYPVAITNNKWMYYVSDSALIREIIAQ